MGWRGKAGDAGIVMGRRPCGKTRRKWGAGVNAQQVADRFRAALREVRSAVRLPATPSTPGLDVNEELSRTVTRRIPG